MPLNNDQLADVNNKLSALGCIIDLYELGAVKSTGEVLPEESVEHAFNAARVSFNYIVQLIKDNA
jgi:hypothetical protein